jgi:hypothetical protein
MSAAPSSIPLQWLATFPGEDVPFSAWLAKHPAYAAVWPRVRAEAIQGLPPLSAMQDAALDQALVARHRMYEQWLDRLVVAPPPGAFGVLLDYTPALFAIDIEVISNHPVQAWLDVARDRQRSFPMRRPGATQAEIAELVSGGHGTLQWVHVEACGRPGDFLVTLQMSTAGAFLGGASLVFPGSTNPPHPVISEALEFEKHARLDGGRAAPGQIVPRANFGNWVKEYVRSAWGLALDVDRRGPDPDSAVGRATRFMRQSIREGQLMRDAKTARQVAEHDAWVEEHILPLYPGRTLAGKKRLVAGLADLVDRVGGARAGAWESATYLSLLPSGCTAHPLLCVPAARAALVWQAITRALPTAEQKQAFVNKVDEVGTKRKSALQDIRRRTDDVAREIAMYE